MRVVCAWCNKVLSAAESDDRVSHGICPECRHALSIRGTQTLDQLLNDIDIPVVAVDADSTALLSNRAAERVLGKGVNLISGQLLGKVVECVYAHHPGGCGRTIHCTGCAIRNAITATYRDGLPRRGVETEKLVLTADGTRLARFTFSAEKTGEAVLVILDDIKILEPEAEGTA